MILEAVLDHDQSVALRGPGPGDGRDGRIAADAHEACRAGGVVGLDGLDRRMVGEEAPALLERHLVAERLPDVADRRAGQAEEGVTDGEEVLADLLQLRRRGQRVEGGVDGTGDEILDRDDGEIGDPLHHRAGRGVESVAGEQLDGAFDEILDGLLGEGTALTLERDDWTHTTTSSVRTTEHKRQRQLSVPRVPPACGARAR